LNADSVIASGLLIPAGQYNLFEQV